MKKRMYIAGCGGMLGEAFYRQFKDEYTLKCTDIDVNEEWLSFLDFREFNAYRKDVKNFGPDILVHLGAYTDLEFCEQNPDDTYMTNTLSVENAVYIANELEIPVVYISTAGIFDGKKPVYDDWDIPNPLGVYARSKYMGERFVIENAKRYYIFRAGWMMGGGKKDKKFIKKIYKQIQQKPKKIFVVNDKNGTPTYTYDFAYNIQLVLDLNLYGLYNMSCEGNTSRYEVAEFMLKYLKKDIELVSVSTAFFSDTYWAQRPESECLINKKLYLRKLNKMRNWKQTLSEYLDSGLLK